MFSLYNNKEIRILEKVNLLFEAKKYKVYDMTTGKKIKELRKEKNWSQKDLAELTHINKTLITRYELDKAKPTANGLMKLAKIFNVTVDYLLLGTADNDVIGDRELFEIFKQVENFNVKNRQLAKEILLAIIAKEKEEFR